MDFASARNFSISKATGEWILILDADEALAPNQKELINSCLTSEAEAFQVQVINYLQPNLNDYSTDIAVRIFKNEPNYRFTGSLHEKIFDVILKKNPRARILNLPEIQILHYGYLPSVVSEKNKSARNLKILIKQFKRSKEPFLLYALGCEYYQLEQYEQALPFFEEHLRLEKGTYGYESDLVNKTLWCYKELRNYPKALQQLERALVSYPDFTDLYFSKAIIYWELKNYPQALASLDTCLSMGEAPPVYTSFSGVGSFRAFFAKGLISEEQLRLRDALNYYLSSLKNNSSFLEPITRILNLFKEWSTLEDGLNFLQQHIDFTSKPLLVFLAKKLINMDEFSVAEECLKEWAKPEISSEDQKDANLAYLLGVIAFYKSNFVASLNYLQQASSNRNLYSKTLPFRLAMEYLLEEGKGISLILQKVNFKSSLIKDENSRRLAELLITIGTLLIKVQRPELTNQIMSILNYLYRTNSEKKAQLKCNFGSLLNKYGYEEEGIKLLEQGCQKTSSDLENLITLHYYYLKNSNWEKTKSIEVVILGDYNIPKAYLMLANNYQRLHKF